MFIVRSGKPPRMSQTPSAATSMVTAVGPRPTFCCPDLSLAMGARYIGILGSVKWSVVLLAFAGLRAGCGGGPGGAGGSGHGAAPAGGAPAPNEPLPASAPAFAARLTAVGDELRR